MKERLLIIGAGMASAYLLQELQQYSHDLDITLVGEEEQGCYNRVLLSSVLAGEKQIEDLTMLDCETSQNINRISGLKIERINTTNKVAVSHLGTQYAYDKLVLATGSRVALPPIANLHLEGIEVFRSIEDTLHLQSLESKHRSAIVVGGGLLGLEAAHGLNAQGFATTVVHRNPHLMNRQLDSRGSELLETLLTKKGIGFHLATEISQLHHCDRKINAVSLTNGDYLACDLLLFATGIEPNTTLAKESNISVDKGIPVTAAMESSAPHIYALGECSQMGKECFGLVAPIRAQATVLARQLAGLEAGEYTSEKWPTTLKISGIDIFSAGTLDENAQSIVLNAPSLGIYRRLVIEDNRLIGAVLVGDKRHGGWYSELIKQQADISNVRSTLMFGPQDTQEQPRHDIAA
ncbi:MAG: NAD(P)/FAD-dependent oxidoreductase [Halioglobus sp.]